MKRQGEGALQHSIRLALEALGHIVIRVQSGKVQLGTGAQSRWVHLAMKGTPDLLVLGRDGKATWLEVKLPTGKVSPAQMAWHSWARTYGHRVAVVRSVSEALAAAKA